MSGAAPGVGRLGHPASDSRALMCDDWEAHLHMRLMCRSACLGDSLMANCTEGVTCPLSSCRS